MTPFLTIVTRACRRPIMLANCIRSVLAQSCLDWEQVFIVDQSQGHPEGNVLWANRQFAANVHRIDGRYVFMLDDDGFIVSPHFVQAVKNLAEDEGYPDVILVKSLSPGSRRHIVELPPANVWDLEWELGERPKKWAGHGYNEVVKTTLWKACAGAYNVNKGGDFYFMTALLTTGATVVRCKGVRSAQSTMRGKGKVFEPCKPDWWQTIAKQFNIANLGGNDWRLRPTPIKGKRGRKGGKGF